MIFRVGSAFYLINLIFAEAYNILAVVPFPSKSHYAVVDPLLMRLAELGHDVTVYDPFPKNKKIPRYTEHDTSHCSVSEMPVILSIENLFNLLRNMYLGITGIFLYSVDEKMIMECTPLYELLNSTKKFDLFITSSFNTDIFLIYANKFKVPFITYFSANKLFPWLADRMQNPQNPSYVPELTTGFLSNMTFVERVKNTSVYLFALFYYNFFVLTKYEKVNKHLLGASAKPLYDTIRNTSILFLNSHNSFSSVVPLVPTVVEIGGIHIKSPAALPKDIEKFINESKHGVIYFCMGSLLRGDTFPEEKRDAFLYAFSQISQRVLWKWEGDLLPGKSDNVMIAKWMPQRDILAHPNVKLFISHGGLLGTTEAVYEGVPILGIPIFGDQRTNVRAIESNGAGELLDYNDITKEVVLEKIQRIINDPKYRENAKQLSDRYRDRPMSPLDTAVYWTEYVIRHKGAPHLKTAAVDLSWYQYLLLDVIAFLIFIFISIILISYYVFKIIFKITCNLVFNKKNVSKKTVEKEKKIN